MAYAEPSPDLSKFEYAARHRRGTVVSDARPDRDGRARTVPQAGRPLARAEVGHGAAGSRGGMLERSGPQRAILARDARCMTPATALTAGRWSSSFPISSPGRRVFTKGSPISSMTAMRSSPCACSTATKSSSLSALGPAFAGSKERSQTVRAGDGAKAAISKTSAVTASSWRRSAGHPESSCSRSSDRSTAGRATGRVPAAPRGIGAAQTRGFDSRNTAATCSSSTLPPHRSRRRRRAAGAAPAQPLAVPDVSTGGR